MQIVARFYKVQYQHMKRGRAFVFASNFLGVNWQNWMTSD